MKSKHLATRKPTLAATSTDVSRATGHSVLQALLVCPHTQPPTTSAPRGRAVLTGIHAASSVDSECVLRQCCSAQRPVALCNIARQKEIKCCQAECHLGSTRTLPNTCKALSLQAGLRTAGCARLQRLSGKEQHPSGYPKQPEQHPLCGSHRHLPPTNSHAHWRVNTHWCNRPQYTLQ